MKLSFRWLYLFAANTCLLLTSLPAQIPAPATFSLPTDQLERYLLPAQDNQALLDREMEQRQSGRPPRFATPIPVQLNPATAGRWDIIGQLAVWRLRLYSPGAHSLNLGFTQYQMPEGGKLYLYDPAKGQKRGPFTPADNESHDQLWTPVFPGDEIIVEIQVPLSNQSKLEIELSVVNHDFLGFGQLSSGSCNLDIICGLEDGWDMVEPFRDVARSVGLYSVQGTLLCTGLLVNNSQEDCTPYFLTAYHCQVTSSTAPSVVVYWNFENSTCRQPDSFESSQSGDGKLEDFNTGSIFRSSWSNSDFCLLELDDPVSETANAYFAGWSAQDELPQERLVSIHHPFTDEKRISFSDNLTRFGIWGSSNEVADGNHLIVNSWEVGTTEEGSSGGPLFNRQGQVIGQLHGGEAACGNNAYDAYGRVFSSWEGGGTPDSRLKDWLDPINLGRLSMNGREQDRCNLSVIGTFASGNICVGGRDTLRLHFGDGFDSIPEIAIGNIAPELDFTLESIPADTDDSFSFVWLSGPGTPAGEQIFEVYTTYQEQTDTSYILLNIDSNAPPSLLAPADLTEIQDLTVNLRWETTGTRKQYHLQLALDPEFNNIFSDQMVEAAPSVVVSDLVPNSTYYWRVAVENACGLSPWSETYSFNISDVNCQVVVGADTPVLIPSAAASTISSELELEVSGTLVSIAVNNLNIKHNWIGDLSVRLRSPSGTEIALLDRPGFPSSLYGCEGTDLLISFSETTSNQYQNLETACNFSSPAISGTYKSLESLEALIGEPAGGTWTLIVEDNADDDGGSLLGWELSICTIPEKLPLIAGLTDAYSVCLEDSLRLELVVSEAFTEDAVNLAIDPMPLGASASFSKNPAAPGDTVFMVLHEFSNSGNYQLELIASDGLTSGLIPFNLEVKDIPPPVTLQAPAADASLSTPNTTFSWSPSGNAIYRLEIAADPEFNTILTTAETASTFYTLELPEQEGAFFWRIIAVNDCGERNSSIFSFIFTPSAVSDFRDGQQAKVYPNPFGNHLFLTFTQALKAPVQLRVMNVNGQVQFSGEISAGSIRHELSLDRLSPGIYLLELKYLGQRHLQKLIKVL